MRTVRPYGGLFIWGSIFLFFSLKFILETFVSVAKVFTPLSTQWEILYFIGWIVAFFFLLSFIAKLFASKLSKLAVPDRLPNPGHPDNPKFGRGEGHLLGSVFARHKFCGFPLRVCQGGYDKQGRGILWLSDEVIAFTRSPKIKPTVIPYGLVHNVIVRGAPLKSFHLSPGIPYLHIFWGRPEFPLRTMMAVSNKKDETEAWAQEIMRRAGVWKEKLAASQAMQAQ
jgi:hypothetical protein